MIERIKQGEVLEPYMDINGLHFLILFLSIS
jgi:hypothetical protein